MKVIKQLPAPKIAQLTEHIEANLKPLATAEMAKCARGRLNLWLQAEPNYGTRKYMKAHTDEWLWTFIQHVDPNAACAQIYFAVGNHGIDWHRDASYAKPLAHIVNLGKVCLECRDREDNLTSLELTGGEVIQFNAKHLHRAIPRCDRRIGIGLWQAAIDINDSRNWQ